MSNGRSRSQGRHTNRRTGDGFTSGEMPCLLQGQLQHRVCFGESVARVDILVDANAIIPQPGQFYMIHSPAGFLPRPFSVHDAAPSARHTRLSFLVQSYGPAVQWMLEVPLGSNWTLWGPLGNRFRMQARTIAVAGGIGIAPFYWMAKRLRETGQQLRLLAGFRDGSSAPLIDYHREAGIEIRVATETGELGEKGYVTELLSAELLAEGVPVAACGPPAMLAAVAQRLASTGGSCELSMEETMACGVGACLGCVVPMSFGGVALCCKDGPIFSSALIDWKRYHG